MVSECYSPYGPRIARALRPSADARLWIEDTLQDLWFSVLRCPPPAEVQGDSERLFAWLCRIAQNHLIDRLRRERLRQHVPLTEALHAVTEHDSALERAEQREQVRAVFDCMAKQDELAAQILQLRYMEERSITEITEMLRITANAVDCRLRRAKRKFRDLWIMRGGGAMKSEKSLWISCIFSILRDGFSRLVRLHEWKEQSAPSPT